MARGFAALDEVDLAVIVNVGDDQLLHGLHVSPDLDTVVYTIAEIEGPMGWGRADDTFNFNDELKRFHIDNEFRLGDKDLAVKIYRTGRMAAGASLSEATAEIAEAFGVEAKILPVSDDAVRTEILVDKGGWLSFSEYFVARGHRDEVEQVRFSGAEESTPAPQVIEALRAADIVVIGPSNPPLSIWPVLAVPGVEEAVQSHPRVVCVSPLVGGKALKGPADRVLSSLGLGTGNQAVVAAYESLVDVLVVHDSDAADGDLIDAVTVIAENTLIREAGPAADLARKVVDLWH